MWRKVIKADMQSGGGRSMFSPYLPLGNQWELTLECGHIVHRQPRYKPLSESGRKPVRGGWYYRRSEEDALPPPRKVKCKQCQRRNDIIMSDQKNERD